MKRLLAIFAHPDDEAFGPAGTLAKYAAEGVNIHLLCVTRGEAGKWTNHESGIRNQESAKIHHIREEELLASAKILGIKRVEFLDFVDGTLCNNLYHELAGKIMKKIEAFNPQVVLTFDQKGISGHLDHVAVTMATTFAFREGTVGRKLYYYCEPKSWYGKHMEEYFVYFPPGPNENEITTRIDIAKHWNTKVAAMQAHKSQMKDAQDILDLLISKPRVEHFILQESKRIRPRIPESDFWDGID